jgi:hypothetical protein
MAPRHQLARAFKVVQDTSLTTVAFTSTTVPAQIDSALDITLSARLDDMVECGLSAYWVGSTSTNIAGLIDILSVTSGRYHWTGTTSLGTRGVPGWASGDTTSGSMVGTPITGSVIRAVTADDLASGIITLRPVGWISAAGTRSLHTAGMQFWAKNLGPVDPN